MFKKLILFLHCIILITFISCTKEWQDPNTSVPNMDLPIEEILISPHAYDGAGLTVEGMIWDLNYDLLTDEDIEIPFTSFKLANKSGNYINVFAEGNYPLTEGEQVIVTGIYRREYITKYRNYVNEIEAKSIKIGKTSTLYKIYKYLR